MSVVMEIPGWTGMGGAGMRCRDGVGGRWWLLPGGGGGMTPPGPW